MICVPLANKDLEQIYQALERPEVEMAEIRLDSCPLDAAAIEELFSETDKPLIATFRLADQSQATEAESKLLAAINAGAEYIDLDIDAPAMMCKRLRREAREAGTLLIRSFHDFEGTDSTRSLSAVVEKALHLGADIVKIATTAQSEADIAKVQKLYELFPPENLIAFCMGDEGRSSRLLCLKEGAPFSYASLSPAEATAPGQIPAEEMFKAIYGDVASPVTPGFVGQAPVYPGCSKSCAQRAIILAALAEGTSTLKGYTPCGDNESALNVARTIGARVSVKGDTVVITGTGGKIEKVAELHCGESGFLTRMMIPVLAVCGSTPVRITGEKTLLTRPLPGAIAMLEPFGIGLSAERVPLEVRPLDFARGDRRIDALGDRRIDARGDKELLARGDKELLARGDKELLDSSDSSLSFRPSEARGEISINGSGGSQLVSGLLAALPLCNKNISITLENPKSIPYIFMTLDLMRQFGVNVDCQMEGGEEFVTTGDWSYCDTMVFNIKKGSSYRAADVSLEADWSAAANFMVAGAIFGKADIAGLDTKSLQADLSILDILPLAGASVSQEENGIVHVVKGPLRGFDIDASNCPDLVPAISVLAAFCQGVSTITGVARLATKESNRPGVITEMLGKMGVHARLKGDKLQIEGRSLASRLLGGRLLKGGEYSSYADHRIAMALAVAGIGASEPITIDDKECTAKSFPAFHKIFNSFAGKV